MSLRTAIEKYREDHLPRLHQQEKEFKRLPFKKAIRKASIGEDEKGKIYSHQCRVGREKGTRGADALMEREKEIQKCRSFETIFLLTEDVRKLYHGLGPLWSYDTALRIGFNMGFYPKEVYVQSGVIDGVKKALKGRRPRGRSLPLSTFPVEIQELEPFEAENFLCIWGKGKKKKVC